MNKYYKKLELDKILELLAEQTYSDACREKALKLKPSFDEEEIRTELKKTDDAFKPVSYTHLTLPTTSFV